MGCYEEYKNLLSKTYNEVIKYLLQKYGSVQDDFFREKSYQRFMNSEIKSINPVKNLRTVEGLYRHHIDEIKTLKISDPQFVKKNNISFESQKKERLVYCDLIEHAILHTLIAKETSLKFGFPGLVSHLLPMMFDWYISEVVPELKWQKHYYNKSYLTPHDAFEILKELHLLIDEIPVNDEKIDALTKMNIGTFKQSEIVIDITCSNNLVEFYERCRKREEERVKRIEKRREQERKEREDFRNKSIEKAKLLHKKSPRIDIVQSIYLLKYTNQSEEYEYNSYEEFESRMKKYTKDKILAELKVYLNSIQE
ncbi:hypothetical protein [Oceanobacillus sojae]|uniref:hypothetical protein n=1 Tax=Oceanobacillus sojae TaxID=582851 RepID=UPI00362E9782